MPQPEYDIELSNENAVVSVRRDGTIEVVPGLDPTEAAELAYQVLLDCYEEHLMRHPDTDDATAPELATLDLTTSLFVGLRGMEIGFATSPAIRRSIKREMLLQKAKVCLKEKDDAESSGSSEAPEIGIGSPQLMPASWSE